MTAIPSTLRRAVLSSTVLVVLAIASLVVMNELNRLIGDILAGSGRTYDITGVIGLGAWTARDAWSDWAGASFSPFWLIAAHIAGDLVFILCYFLLLRRLVRYATAQRDAEAAALHARLPECVRAIRAPVMNNRYALALPIALLAADLLEDVFLVILDLALKIAPTGTDLSGLAVPLAIATYLKWAATVAVLVWAIIGARLGPTLRSFFPRAARALYAQRLSALAVVAIGVVSLVTADGVLEQVADVYRGWFTYAPDGTTGLTLRLDHMGFSFLTFMLTGFSLLVLGRQRARRYLDSTKAKESRGLALHYPWFIFLGLVGLLALLVAINTAGASIDRFPLGGFVVAIGGIVLASFFIQRHYVRAQRPFPKPFLSLRLADAGADVRLTGDLIVLAWVVVWALGPFKALLSPLVLAAAGSFSGSRFANIFPVLLGIEIVLLALGLLVAVAFRWATSSDPTVGRWLRGLPGIGALANDLLTTTDTASDKRNGRLRTLAIVIAVGSIIFFLTCLRLPTFVGYTMGPIAVIVALVGSWTTLLGALILLLGGRAPLALFRVLRLRSVPVIALLVILPLVVTSIDGPPALHAIRTAEGNTVATRPQLTGALDTWTKAQSCSIDIGGGVFARPLLLVAAQGGGIRAATWTVDVMRELPRDGDCAANATLLSSGASGGSIGLASFRDAKDPANLSTQDYGGPDALAADLVGLLAGDLIGSLTGIRITTSNDVTDIWAWSPDRAWHDRTALQELTWEHQWPEFADPWDGTAQSPTGLLVLNSTDSVSNCKVVVSQVDLNPEAPGTEVNPVPQCVGAEAELSNTVDLYDHLGAECFSKLSWATAAELSARFPFVSPSGRISEKTVAGACHGVADMQLVDGGLTDNSALGTISDVAPVLADFVAVKNAAATGSKTSPFIVPVIMYVQNEPGEDVTAATDVTRPEILVPMPTLKSAPLALLTPGAWLTRLSSEYADVCPVDAATFTKCSDAVTAVREQVPQGVAVVAPTTTPAVSVPLGWTLSSFARSRLRLEALTQAECGKSDPDPHYSCAASTSEYGELGDVLDLFDGEKANWTTAATENDDD